MREKITFKTTLCSYQEGHYMHKLAIKGTSTAYTAESEIHLVFPTFLPSNVKEALNQIHSG